MSTPTTFSKSLITPPPRIEVRDDSNLWGYWPQESSISTFTCRNTEVFTSSRNFAGCYGTDYLASHSTLNYGCSEVSTTATGQGGVTLCTFPSGSCIAQTIYQTSPFGGALTNYFCGIGLPWSAFTLYRDIPATSSSSSSSTSSISRPPSASNTLSTPTGFITTASVTALGPTATVFLDQTGSNPSKVWISGPVIGAIALVALVSFALWLMRNRRRERNASVDQRLSYNSQLPEMEPEPLEPVGEGGIASQGARMDYGRFSRHEMS